MVDHPAQDSDVGRVVGVYTTTSKAQPMHSHTAIEAIAGVGLRGDRYTSGAGHYSDRPRRDGGRQVTFFENEMRQELAQNFGIAMPAGGSRRNIETADIELVSLIGHQFRIGEAVLCLGVDECTPCKHLEEVSGLPVLEPLVGRGGLRATILSSGDIHVGDKIERVG